MVKRQIMASELAAQAEGNGYKRWAHKEQVTIRYREKHEQKTRID
jgi:hypothetical protein